MARYYFNLDNSVGLVRDEEGRELPDLETAREEAIRGCRALIADDVLKGRLDLAGRIEVLDENGALLFAVRYADAVVISGTSSLVSG